jgi:hypothetical protein
LGIDDVVVGLLSRLKRGEWVREGLSAKEGLTVQTGLVPRTGSCPANNMLTTTKMRLL